MENAAGGEAPLSPAYQPASPLYSSSPHPLSRPSSCPGPGSPGNIPSSAAISGAVIAPSYSGQHFMFQNPAGGQLPHIAMPTAAGQHVTLDTLSNQVFTLSQIVMGLSQKVSDNARLYEENIRLKDIVIDLEFKLKDANERVRCIDGLRDTVVAQFAELNRSLQHGSRVGDMGGGYGSRAGDMGGDEAEGAPEATTGDYDSFLNVSREDVDPIKSDLLNPEPGYLYKVTVKFSITSHYVFPPLI